MQGCISVFLKQIVQCRDITESKQPLRMLMKAVKSILSIKCTAPYPPRLQRIAFTVGSSIASCKSLRRCLIVPAYLPEEPPACFPMATFKPHDSIRFRAPFRNSLSILLEGDTMTTLSPGCKRGEIEYPYSILYLLTYVCKNT